MSSMVVCDLCGKPLVKPFYKMRITKQVENEASNMSKTVGAIDMHEPCLARFKEWVKETRMKEIAK